MRDRERPAGEEERCGCPEEDPGVPGGGLKGVTGALRLPDGVMVVLREVPGDPWGNYWGSGGVLFTLPPLLPGRHESAVDGRRHLPLR